MRSGHRVYFSFVFIFVCSALTPAMAVVSNRKPCDAILGELSTQTGVSARLNITKEKEQDLFKQYRTNPSAELRAQIMEEFLPVVLGEAAKTALKAPPNLDPVDFFLDGQEGLKDAIETFKPEKGVRFSTFARPRIAGSIKDAQREQDFIPRLVRLRTRFKEKAREEILKENHDAIITRDLIKETLITKILPTLAKPKGGFRSVEEHAERILEEEEAQNMERLDGAPRENSDDDSTPSADWHADRRLSFAVNFSSKDLRNFILKNFSRAEQLVIICIYYEDMTQAEVAKVVGFSESMVSRMHTEIIQRLKSRLRPEHLN